MQTSKEYQGEIRKPSSVISAKKYRKTIEWENLEISSRKCEVKWALGSITTNKASGGDGIQLSYLKS